MSARTLLLIVGLVLAATFALADGPPPSSLSATAPMPNDQKVPAAWLPPGAFDPDTGPSDVIYPPQELTLRFNHKLHVKGLGEKCTTCHPGGASSDSAQDGLIPKGTACDGCHGTKHADPNAVTGGGGPMAACVYCHQGYRAGDGNQVARFVIPRPNMVFSHKRHVVRNIGCPQCHGAVEELELATRDQMPRMRGCFRCHQMTDAASRGDARSACDTCHLRAGPDPRPLAFPGNAPAVGTGASEGGTIRTLFPSGVLKPPRWLHDAEHGPDFLERHKNVAGADSAFCQSCHKEDFCVGCHDGRVRPRSIHPNDDLNMHPIEARMATQKCTSCHREQSFCITCHLRVGVAESSPLSGRDSGRFHPPKAGWSELRGPTEHALEARRNLNACVSCHIERDCVVCHGAGGVGGSFNVHHVGFAATCASQMRRNPRPCFVCHDPGDGKLAQCR